MLQSVSKPLQAFLTAPERFKTFLNVHVLAETFINLCWVWMYLKTFPKISKNSKPFQALFKVSKRFGCRYKHLFSLEKFESVRERFRTLLSVWKCFWTFQNVSKRLRINYNRLFTFPNEFTRLQTFFNTSESFETFQFLLETFIHICEVWTCSNVFVSERFWTFENATEHFQTFLIVSRRFQATSNDSKRSWKCLNVWVLVATIRARLQLIIIILLFVYELFEIYTCVAFFIYCL